MASAMADNTIEALRGKRGGGGRVGIFWARRAGPPSCVGMTASNACAQVTRTAHHVGERERGVRGLLLRPHNARAWDVAWLNAEQAATEADG